MTKKKILSVALISVLTVFVFCLCFYFSGNALNQLPSITQMNYNLKSDEKPLTVKDMNNLSDRISFNQVSFCVELDETNVKEETVTPVLTNEFYFEIWGQKLNGNSITEENIKNENKVAVISSSLALKLFFNTDAVGKTITLNDEVYTICGVIQESENIINSLSSDGKQRIYIPYTCYSGYENCDVYTISYDNSASSAPLIEQMKLSQYHSTNFSEKANVIRNFENIIFLILFIALCFLALRLWYRICKKLIKDIKENLSENYILNSLKSIPIKYVLLAITAFGIPVVLLIIFFLSDFSIFIISKYIPYDNIFDVSYYLNTIIENSNMANNLALTGDTFLINLYSNSFSLLIWHVIIFAIIFIAVLSVIWKALSKLLSSV
ncbi:ABC transporter permease [uncultured Ruminococcus sp.]|jgi:putative ABC transport system permease protein|uniref:ABC transporter permease n=1 Tax=uncultured Ruminococcus sp. TaxID=165186 RepID=UPI0026658E45|nr:ABC transporter permease [uncultured Ruminococcus sp.]